MVLFSYQSYNNFSIQSTFILWTFKENVILKYYTERENNAEKNRYLSSNSKFIRDMRRKGLIKLLKRFKIKVSTTFTSESREGHVGQNIYYQRVARMPAINQQADNKAIAAPDGSDCPE